MNRKTIDDRQKALVKELWINGTTVDGRNGKIYCHDISISDFCKILDYDLHTLALMTDGKEIKEKLEYYHEEKEEGIIYSLECKLYVEGMLWENTSVCLTSDSDFMGFFMGFADTTDDFFSGKSYDIAEKIREKYPEVYEYIADNLDDDAKEDIGRAWAEDNPDDAYEVAISNISSYGLREKIKDAIDEL